MANKTTSIPKSQEQSVKAASLQSQLVRIKKEEEEEIWISGEELYTEGSSDEEEYKTRSRSRTRRKLNSNRSSRASSANPREQRDNSLLSTESKAKLDQSTNASKTGINESQSASGNVSKYEQMSLKNLSLTAMESLPNMDRLPTVQSAVNSSAKDSCDCFLSEEEQIQDTEISWKAHRESYENEELLEDDWKDDTEISSISSAEDECIRKEISEMKSLDNLIRAMNDKVKKAIEETLFYQCENRKRLENILTSSPSENGKLARNTRQFFHLCPKYSTTNAEFRKDDDETLIENADRVNILELDNEIEWKFVDSTDSIGNINDATEDSYSNPYIVNTEIKETLLEDEEEEVQLLKMRNDVISTFDTVSTTKCLKDIDRILINEMIEEALIVDPTSIVNFAEHELDSRDR